MKELRSTFMTPTLEKDLNTILKYSRLIINFWITEIRHIGSKFPENYGNLYRSAMGENNKVNQIPMN